MGIIETDTMLLVGMLLAIGAGALSFLSPCVLPIFPAYMSYITGISVKELQGNKNRKIVRQLFAHSFFFLLAVSLVFLSLGASASFLGQWAQKLLVQLNKRQKIVLVASEFDEQTKSAVAWLNSNGVEIACYQLLPYKWNNQLFIDSKKILPVEKYEDYYVDLVSNSSPIRSKKSIIKKRSLPRIHDMLKWGVIQEGDELKAKNKDATATLLANGNVKAKDKELSLQQWLKNVTGWPSVQTYAQTVHAEKGKTLSEIREAYMSKNLNQ